MTTQEFLSKWMPKDNPEFIGDVAALIDMGRGFGVAVERERCARIVESEEAGRLLRVDRWVREGLAAKIRGGGE